jgi:hypothetical protein
MGGASLWEGTLYPLSFDSMSTEASDRFRRAILLLTIPGIMDF